MWILFKVHFVEHACHVFCDHQVVIHVIGLYASNLEQYSSITLAIHTLLWIITVFGGYAVIWIFTTFGL